jgi:flagellin-like protein
MKKLGIKLNKRGVSPIIATLLLVAIAVAAAVVTYTWTMSMAQNQSTQSQTNVKMDQVMFGKTTVVTTAINFAAGYSAGATSIVVDSTVGFAVGDKITVETQVRTIAAIPDGTTLTIDALTEAIDDNDLVERPAAEGLWISVRNTGSIASTIETMYLYEGDTLLTTSGITINNVISPNSAEGIGIVDTGASGGDSYFANLLSAGKRLPNADFAVSGDISASGTLDLNSPYTIRLVTTTGFIVEGTYFTPGSFS